MAKANRASQISSLANSVSATTKSADSTFHLFKTRPSYKKLIIKALRESPRGINTKKGTSAQYIQKFIKQRYVTPQDKTLRRFLSKRLKELQEEGKVVMVKRSFRFSPQMKKQLKEQQGGIQKNQKMARQTHSRTKRRKSQTRAKNASGSGLRTATMRAGRVSTTSSTNSWSTFSGPTAFSSSSQDRSNNAKLTAPPSGYIWQYYHDGFRNYDIEASEIVNTEYESFLEQGSRHNDVRSVKSGNEGFHYQIFFATMTQTNIDHVNHTERRIRRVKWEDDAA